MFSKARYLSKIGSWDEALAAYNDILQKEKVGTSKKIDATMEKAKIALFKMVTTLWKLYFYDYSVSISSLYIGYHTTERLCDRS